MAVDGWIEAGACSVSSGQPRLTLPGSQRQPDALSWPSSSQCLFFSVLSVSLSHLKDHFQLSLFLRSCKKSRRSSLSVVRPGSAGFCINHCNYAQERQRGASVFAFVCVCVWLWAGGCC